MSRHPSLTPQQVCRTGSKPGTTGRLFEGQQDLPQPSGGGTTQRSESAGWASPPAQTLGRVPGWQGGGSAQRSVCGAVCYWSCLASVRQWASGPSAEWTRTTAEPPGSAAWARRAPRWTWGRPPSWVPSRVCVVSIRVLDTSQIRDQSRREVGGRWASSFAYSPDWALARAPSLVLRPAPFLSCSVLT